MMDRKNWVYPDEERLTSIVYTKEAMDYFNQFSKRVQGMSMVNFIKACELSKINKR